MAPLGIGIITRERLSMLQSCVSEIMRYTRNPYFLMIADDDSTDDTVSWARSRDIPVVTGPRRGVAWNKNRALYFLQTLTHCDPILLFEEKAWPVRTGWDQVWVEAARRWQHVNLGYGWRAGTPMKWPKGSGTVDDPYQCYSFGGCCTITTRRALAEVGFLNTRFIGYGWGHVEWTHRYRLRYRKKWGLADRAVPCLDHGVKIAGGVTTYRNEEDFERNKQLYAEIRANGENRGYCGPWSNDDEAKQLRGEVADARRMYWLNREINESKQLANTAGGPRTEITLG